MADPAADPTLPSVTRLPLFTGNPAKDGVTAEQFIQRVENAAAAAGWNDAQTLAIAKSYLRDKALDWNEYITSCGSVDVSDFNPGYKRYFLQHFKRERTAHSAVSLLEGLKQKPNEDVLSYFIRVSNAFQALKRLKPDFAIPAGWTNANGGAAFMALTAEQKAVPLTRARTIFNGNNDEFYMIQFFLAGLKEDIKQRVYDRAPDNGYTNSSDCLIAAREIEMLLGRKALVDAPVPNMAPVQENVEAVRGRGRGRSFHRGHRGGRGNAPGRGGFTGVCFRCNRAGHRKADCKVNIGEVSSEGQQEPAQNQETAPGHEENQANANDYGHINAVGYGFDFNNYLN